MIRSSNDRKNRYYDIIAEKGRAVYASWGKNGIRSKKLVATANQYVFDKRLKTDAAFRFQVLAFAYALGLRLEKRYSTFLRKLLRIFAFLRERNALNMLKRVLGFNNHTDIRTIIETEAEKIFVLLSQRGEKNTRRGGKRSGVNDLETEEELQNFFEEYLQEDAQKDMEEELHLEEAEAVENTGEPSSATTENAEREQISVDEIEPISTDVEGKKNVSKEIKTEQLEKREADPTPPRETEQKEIEVPESVKEKPVEQSAATISILAEMMMLEQDHAEKTPSPFPIFREGKEAQGGKAEAITDKDQGDVKPGKEKAEGADRNTRSETERGKTPFPVFHGEKGNSVKGPEKPMEKSEDKPIEKSVEQPDVKAESKPPMQTMKISEENKARIALNISMDDQQISALAMQIKEAANAELAREEIEWREQISVTEGVNNTQPSVKTVANSQNSTVTQPSAKK